MEKIGDEIVAKNADWRFSGKVVEQFDRHISKSVPLYYEGHRLVENLSDFFIKDDSICYELGSSTGRLLYKVAQRHSFRKSWFIGIEIEDEMVNRANSIYRADNLVYIKDDINSFEYEKSDMIISYYTMQFIHPKYRQDLFDKIYKALNWGGAFVLFEKVRANDARFQDILTTLYTEYKLKMGYTPEEIIAKSRSLKGVLEPFSTQGNIDLLKRAGFVDIITIQKYMNFEGFLAIK